MGLGCVFHKPGQHSSFNTEVVSWIWAELTEERSLHCAARGFAEQKCRLFSSSDTFVSDGGALCGFKDKILHQHCKALCAGAAVLTPGERQWQEEASLPFWKRMKPLADLMKMGGEETRTVLEKRNPKPSLQMGI